MKDKYIESCPYCGGLEIIESMGGSYSSITASNNLLGGVKIYYSVCRKCGTIIRSYVKEPEKLLKKKDRKKVE